MRHNGPNWGLAFSSASFLIVWCLGFLSGQPLEVIAVRACVATLLGALVGILVDRTARSLRSIKTEEPAKGQQVDFTLPADDLELQIPGSSNPNERTSVVPKAQGASTDAPESFQPLDFKKTARQVQNTMKE